MDINVLLAEYWHYIGPFLIFLMILESAPIIGFVIPGSFLLPVIGAMAGNGNTSFWFLFICAASGAFIGDLIGYWLGRKGSNRWLPAVLSNQHQQVISSAREQVKKHGLLAVFFGRFTWLIHPAIPGAAGFLGVKASSFLLIDPIAVMLWVLVYMGAGYLLTGFWVERTLELFEILAVVVTVLLILWLLRYLGHYILRRFVRND